MEWGRKDKKVAFLFFIFSLPTSFSITFPMLLRKVKGLVKPSAFQVSLIKVDVSIH